MRTAGLEIPPATDVPVTRAKLLPWQKTENSIHANSRRWHPRSRRHQSHRWMPRSAHDAATSHPRRSQPAPARSSRAKYSRKWHAGTKSRKGNMQTLPMADRRRCKMNQGPAHALHIAGSAHADRDERCAVGNAERREMNGHGTGRSCTTQASGTFERALFARRLEREIQPIVIDRPAP